MLDADFVAIDFETANRYRWSACSVGVAIVAGGRIVDHGSALINPDGEFSPNNQAIHGLGPDDVASAPRFHQLWPELAELLDGQLMIAHVASFDIGVLRQCVAREELDGIDIRAACSWRTSRLVWEALPSYGLGYMCKHLALAHSHHEAGSDALACAEVMLAATKHVGAADVAGLFANYSLQPGTLTADSFVGHTVFDGDLRNLEGDKAADPDHPLFSRRICFTGAMFSMTRGEAAERIVDFGADFKKNMSGEVDMLVIGDADFVKFADGHQTGKMKVAAKLLDEGHPVEIVAERDFLAMLQS